MNLLLSMADQLRFDALSPVTPALHTPGFAALAREGVLFSRAYSSTPTCAPARAALLTGRSPWGHGLLGVGPIALSYPWEFPRTLASVGYQAAVVGKNNFGWNLSAGLEGGREHSHSYQSWQIYDGKMGQHDQYREYFAEQVGYRRYMANGSTPANVCWPTLDMNSWRGAAFACDEELHPTAWAGRKAVAFLRDNRDAGRLGRPPFLLKLSFHRPHSPYDPPQRLLDAVQYDAIPPPARSVDGWSAHFATCDQRGHRAQTLSRLVVRRDAGRGGAARAPRVPRERAFCRREDKRGARGFAHYGAARANVVALPLRPRRRSGRPFPLAKGIPLRVFCAHPDAPPLARGVATLPPSRAHSARQHARCGC